MRLFPITCLACLYTAGFCQVETESTKDSVKPMTLFSKVNVVDVETGEVLRDRDVLVSNSQIISIRKHGNAGVQKQKRLQLIQAQGKYLVPGLVDCHTHIIYKEDLLPYLSNGVTTVFSLGQPQQVLKFREDVKTGALAGPSIYAVALIDTVPQEWGDLLLLSENPLQSIESLRKIEGVMARGRWYTKEQLVTLQNN